MKLIPERNLDRLKKKYNKTVERLLERERMQERTARVYREKFRDKIHDKIVRFFVKIYRFAEKNSRKTRGKKYQKSTILSHFRSD